jgi:GH25 family lysozyme M1 (1,4-beta-N-acetylmuramidase)
MVVDLESAARRAEAKKTNVPNTCQNVTWNYYDSHAVGDFDGDGSADAEDGWKSEPASARHTDRNPPRGKPVSYGGGSHDNGHRAISLGNGKIRTTDFRVVNGVGMMGTVDLDWPEKTWGLTYLGWSDTIDGELIPPAPAKKPTKPAAPAPSTGKLPVDLIDGSHWNLFTVEGVKTAMKAGVHNFALKATEGIDFPDEKYDTYRKVIKEAGARSTGYHFARPKSSNGTLQAKFFLAHAKIKTVADNRIMLDLEDDGGLNKAALTAWVGDFVAEVERVLGPQHYIYTPFSLGKTFGWKLWVARYHPQNALPNIPAPWRKWDIRQFSNGVVGNPHTVPGFNKVDLNNVVGPVSALVLPKLPVVKPDPMPAPKTPKGSLDFRVHLVPGNKKQPSSEIKHDMALVKKVSGSSAVVFNTERESDVTRKAVTDGLGEGWTRVIENENTIAYGPNWHQAPGREAPSAFLLAKEDPSMKGVSPNRYLDCAPLEHDKLKGICIKMKGCHCLSEANCIHKGVLGRAWREKMYPVQIHDILTECELDFRAGFPQVLVGDFNTGKFFTGDQLFDMFKKRFGNKAVHVHNGALDHIFLIGTDKVKLEEIGVEKLTNNASDHDMITATIRATKLK